MPTRQCKTCEAIKPLTDFPTVGAGHRHICWSCLNPEIRRCSKCGAEKPLLAFARQGRGWRGDCKECRASYTMGWSAANPEKVRTAARAWRAANPERVQLHADRNRPRAKVKRRHRTVEQYGLDLVQYNEMLAAQGGGCAICGSIDKSKALAVDHCHDTGRVRGLLCSTCNTGIGRFSDDPALLIRAARYIQATTELSVDPR